MIVWLDLESKIRPRKHILFLAFYLFYDLEEKLLVIIC
jgi:hypothetical protein